jgi:DNA repair exonuclease SbcCD ATPase subunit
MSTAAERVKQHRHQLARIEDQIARNAQSAAAIVESLADAPTSKTAHAEIATLAAEKSSLQLQRESLTASIEIAKKAASAEGLRARITEIEAMRSRIGELLAKRNGRRIEAALAELHASLAEHAADDRELVDLLHEIVRERFGNDFRDYWQSFISKTVNSRVLAQAIAQQLASGEALRAVPALAEQIDFSRVPLSRDMPTPAEAIAAEHQRLGNMLDAAVQVIEAQLTAEAAELAK